VRAIAAVVIDHTPCAGVRWEYGSVWGPWPAGTCHHKYHTSWSQFLPASPIVLTAPAGFPVPTSAGASG